MKLKEGFMLKEIAGEWVVVPLGAQIVQFNEMITLTETGALLWQMLEQETDELDMINRLLNEYEVSRETAEQDVKEFIDKIQQKSFLV